MDFLLLTQNPLGAGLLLFLFWLLIRKVADIVWVIVVSKIAKTLANNGYDVVINKEGVSLVKSKSIHGRRK